MEWVDASEHFEQQGNSEQTPSLLTVILDTNPAAWALISKTLPLAKAVANLLVFINAHLAGNYTNKVAVIASHTDRAQWLYPTPVDQNPVRGRSDTSQKATRPSSSAETPGTPSKKRQRHGDTANAADATNGNIHHGESNKYRPFRMVEEQLTRNLTKLLTSTSPSTISTESSTMVAGAFTLALSYINRETIAYNESLTGRNTNISDLAATQGGPTESTTANNSSSMTLQSRILLVTISPSTDLAHQYIPIMNAIFACQRLNIPIDVLQLPLSTSTSNATGKAANSNSNSTVFLQQAADATHGIFIPVDLSATETSSAPRKSSLATTSIASSALLTYLLTAFLPSPNTRRALILPTRIDVDFRAACFCHRNVISVGFVCSICLSIFCSVPEGAQCLTCGTQLSVSGSGYGAKPVVVPRKKKKKQRSGIATPTPA